MRVGRLLITAVGLFFIAYLSVADAASPVWKVSKGDNFYFLGATIHLLKQADYPLPPAFDEAYQQSSILVLEADVEKLNSAQGKMLLLSRAMLSGEKKLKNELQAETWVALEAHLKQRGLPIASFSKFKPGMMAMTLSVMELQTMGYSPLLGVDMHYVARANKDKKTKDFLEEVEVQLDILGMEGENGDEMIMYTLNDLEKIPSLLSKMKRAWSKGDMDALAEQSVYEFKKEFPAIYKKVLTDRNNNWISKLETFSTTKDVELVLVGGLHLSGDDGLLNMLEKRGYKLENL